MPTLMDLLQSLERNILALEMLNRTKVVIPTSTTEIQVGDDKLLYGIRFDEIPGYRTTNLSSDPRSDT